MIYGNNPDNNVPDTLAISQANNLYTYTVNNPLKYTDPTGFNCEDDDDNLFDLLREIWDDFRPTADNFRDAISSASDLTEWGILAGLAIRGLTKERAIEKLPVGMQNIISNMIAIRHATNLAGVENFFAKMPWIFLGVDIAVNVVQDWQNGESLTRIGSNAYSRVVTGSAAVYTGTKAGGFIASVVAGGKKGGTAGLFVGPKGSLAGALGGAIIGGGIYVAANFTGFIDRLSDEIYRSARGWQVVGRYVWENRPRLRNLFN